ncbi:MAG: ATP-binding cassette domain-containing protein [Lachnospiraceae bacterium]|nr:ATP-binding cassette domain-containing protein [Lachnospiraceae bacterium]
MKSYGNFESRESGDKNSSAVHNSAAEENNCAGKNSAAEENNCAGINSAAEENSCAGKNSCAEKNSCLEQNSTAEQTTKLDELDSAGFIVIPIRGVSMQPLLYTYTSHVLIRKLEGRPRKNDVVLYVRPDGVQVLHRVIGNDGDICLIRGDNTYALERVPLSAVKGVMESAWRGKGGKRGQREIRTTDIRYQLYVKFWNLIYPLRFLRHKAQMGVRTLGRLLLGDTVQAWIVKMVRTSLAGILLLTLCTGATAFLSVILALVMRNAIDYAVALDLPMFLRWCGIFLGIIAAQLALRAVIRQQDESIRASIENKLKEHTYTNILHSTYSGLKAYHTGELLNRMTNDVKVVADYATDLIPGVFSMVVQLVCALVVLMTLDWRFGSLFLVGGVLMLCVAFLFRRRMKRLHKEVQESDGKLRSWLQESVESILIVKSFEAEEMASLRTEKRTAAHKTARMKRRTFSNVCNVGFGAVMQGSYLFGLVWCGFGILRGTLTYGTLTAVLQLISQIRSPFANISGFVPQYYSMIASAERLVELEDLPKEADALKELPEFSGLHAENLTFIYDDGEEEVIRNATFDIERGEIVALTGLSGIGKSTLLKILLGIYAPVSGRLYADCAEGSREKFPENKGRQGICENGADSKRCKNNGTEKCCENQDIQQSPEIAVSPATRRWFSYVPQGNMLMSGSIYEAVDFLHAAPYTRKQKERVEYACKIACADDFIRNLPDGYNTVLGEKGGGLSEGQMQRIAIARAVYRDAPVLLLDEATSALDEDTERRLLKNLREMGRKTVLIVTHRPAAMKICNKRLIFEHSEISVEMTDAD